MMAKAFSFETTPHFYRKNDEGVEPAFHIQPDFLGDLVFYATDFEEPFLSHEEFLPLQPLLFALTIYQALS